MVEWQVIPGLTDYQSTLEIMENHVDKIIKGAAGELVLLTEHKDVYTAGRGYNEEELLGSDIPVIYTGRGGKFTYHGPGQRVIYPMLNLSLENREKDLKKYIKDLEQWIILTMGDVGIKAFTVPERVGIWVIDKEKEKKIGAIGVRVRKWVTYHGIGINVSTDLTKFDSIIPCGIRDFGVTSLQKLGVKISMGELDDILKERFNRVF